jgi:hypothetical protein
MVLSTVFAAESTGAVTGAVVAAESVAGVDSVFAASLQAVNAVAMAKTTSNFFI